MGNIDFIYIYIYIYIYNIDYGVSECSIIGSYIFCISNVMLACSPQHTFISFADDNVV